VTVATRGSHQESIEGLANKPESDRCPGETLSESIVVASSSAALAFVMGSSVPVIFGATWAERSRMTFEVALAATHRLSSCG